MLEILPINAILLCYSFMPIILLKSPIIPPKHNMIIDPMSSHKYNIKL